MANKHGVFTRYDAYRGKEYPTSYCVIEINGNGEKIDDLVAAEFPVNARYSKDTQKNRSFKFCDYMNSLAEVMNDLEKDQQI